MHIQMGIRRVVRRASKLRLELISLTYRDIVKIQTENKKHHMHKLVPHSILGRVRPRIVALSLTLLALALVAVPIVRADNYQAQIDALNAQNSLTQTQLNSLQIQATSYQQAVTAYQTQIADINNAIASNNAKQAADQAQIAADQAQIALNKQYLADDVKTMYVQGQMSMIEELATSQDLSTFVNKQEDDIKIQNNLNSLLSSIKTLQQQAQANADEVAALIKTEQAQQDQVISDQNQQNQLLNMNQQQQSDYNSQLAANNSQIAALKAAQAAAYAAIARTVQVKPSGGGGGACDMGYGNGGYPSVLCNAYQDAVLDAYGMPNRECTSFAYWYYTNIEGHSGLQVSGNAGWWWETSNFAVSTYPDVAVGAMGIEPSSATPAPVPSLHGGWYGHVMIVLALPGTTYDGSLPFTSAAAGTYVPQGYVLVMSMNEDEAGHFMYNLWPANYLMYINPQ